jgi:hypothetical protein
MNCSTKYRQYSRGGIGDYNYTVNPVLFVNTLMCLIRKKVGHLWNSVNLETRKNNKCYFYSKTLQKRKILC